MLENQKRWWNFPAVFCLVTAILISAARLEATDWAEHLGNVYFLALIAVLLGLALGQSRFKPGWVALIAMLYSLAIVPWVWVSTAGKGLEWLARYQGMGIRLELTLGQFFRNEPVTDPILFLWAMGLIYWIASLLAGYHMTRHGKPWIPLAVIAITTYVVEFYIAPLSRSGIYAAVFTLFLILLIALVYFQQSTHRWEKAGVQVEQDTGYNLGRSALVMGLVLVIFAWNLPLITEALSPGTAAHAELSDWLKEIRDRFSNIVAPLQGPSRVDVLTFGDDLALGTGQPNDERMVFIAEELGERDPNTLYYSRYWRARSYNQYEDGEWNSTIRDTAYIPENSSPLALPQLWEGRTEVGFQFTTQINMNLLISPGVLRQASLPMKAVLQPIGSAGLDIVAVEMDPLIPQGEIYQVTSSLASPSVEQLRKSGSEYPLWVRETYLQLPDDFPERIAKLAREIAFQKETQYDKVVAITYYLRDNMTYKEIIPEPPRRTDPIEWFLFEQKEGYCNYYATAEVLMLRSIGIPARLVVGYAQGEPTDNPKAFQVLAKHSHAWPEVYFDDIGWVEFEPTAGLPAIFRPTDLFSGVNGTSFDFEEEMRDWRNRGPLENPTGGDAMEEPEFVPEIAVEEETRTGSSWAYPIGIILVLVMVGIWLTRRNIIKIPKLPPVPIMAEKFLVRTGWVVPGWLHRKADEARLLPVEKAFLVVEKSLRRLKQPVHPAQTPAEKIRLLITALPQVEEAAGVLLSEYHQSVYGQFEGDAGKAVQAARDIRKLTMQAWLQNLLNRSMERFTD